MDKLPNKNIIFLLSGAALLVGVVLYVFRYEYVVINQDNGLSYIVRFDRLNSTRCMEVTDSIQTELKDRGTIRFIPACKDRVSVCL